MNHLIAGRMFGHSGCVTFCTCGLAFFGPFQGMKSDSGFETAEQRVAAREWADERWQRHASESDQ